MPNTTTSVSPYRSPIAGPWAKVAGCDALQQLHGRVCDGEMEHAALVYRTYVGSVWIFAAGHADICGNCDGPWRFGWRCRRRLA